MSGSNVFCAVLCLNFILWFHGVMIEVCLYLPMLWLFLFYFFHTVICYTALILMVLKRVPNQNMRSAWRTMTTTNWINGWKCQMMAWIQWDLFQCECDTNFLNCNSLTFLKASYFFNEWVWYGMSGQKKITYINKILVNF